MKLMIMLLGAAPLVFCLGGTAHAGECVFAGKAYSDGAEKGGQMCSNGHWTGRASGGGGVGGASGGMSEMDLKASGYPVNSGGGSKPSWDYEPPKEQK